MFDFTKAHLLDSGNYLTPKGRLSYPNLATPNPKAKVTSGKNAGSFKYTVSLLIPPTADISLLRKAAGDAALEEFGAEKLKAYQEAKRLHSPFLDAFEKSRTERNPSGDEWQKGWTLLRLDSMSRPGIVGPDGKDVEDIAAEAYAGRWAVISVAPSAYPAIDGGKPGVKFYIQNIKLLDHDDPIGGGRVAARDEFAGVAGVDPATAGETGGADTDAVFG